MYIVLILTFLFGCFITFIGVVLRLNAKNAGYGLEKYIDYSAMQNAEIVISIGIGLLIFAVVFLIVRIIKNNQERKKQLNTKKCISCGNIVDVKQNFCNKCGNRLRK